MDFVLKVINDKKSTIIKYNLRENAFNRLCNIVLKFIVHSGQIIIHFLSYLSSLATLYELFDGQTDIRIRFKELQGR